MVRRLVTEARGRARGTPDQMAGPRGCRAVRVRRVRGAGGRAGRRPRGTREVGGGEGHRRVVVHRGMRRWARGAPGLSLLAEGVLTLILMSTLMLILTLTHFDIEFDIDIDVDIDIHVLHLHL